MAPVHPTRTTLLLPDKMSILFRRCDEACWHPSKQPAPRYFFRRIRSLTYLVAAEDLRKHTGVIPNHRCLIASSEEENEWCLFFSVGIMRLAGISPNNQNRASLFLQGCNAYILSEEVMRRAGSCPTDEISQRCIFSAEIMIILGWWQKHFASVPPYFCRWKWAFFLRRNQALLAVRLRRQHGQDQWGK